MRLIFIIIASFFFLKSYGQSDHMELSANSLINSSHFYEENGKMGLKKNSRKHLTPPVYDTLIVLNDNSYVGKRYSTNKQQALWGILSNNGEVILPFEFFSCKKYASLVVLGAADNNRLRKGVYNFAGKQIISTRYESIIISDKHIVARSEESNNIFSLEGIKLAEFKADSVKMLDENYVTVYLDGKAGLEALDNSVSLAARYEAIKVEDGVIYGKPFPKWLLINSYDTITFFRQDIKTWGQNFIVGSGEKCQVVNREKTSISATYDAIEPISAERAKVKRQNRWGMIDNKGREIIAANYSSILADKEFIGARAVSNISKWSVYDLYGYLKSQLTYDSLKPMSEGRIPAKRNGHWGYLDRYGVEIISPIFEMVENFKNERAHVRFFGQSGIIDRAGQWVVPPINRQILDFNAEVILTKSQDQYQLINDDNELIYFSGNMLKLSADGIDELDSAGNIIRKISWQGTILSDIFSGERVRAGGSGLTIFKANARYGFKDQQGRIIIANRYEGVKAFHEGMAAVKIRNKWGFIDLDEIIRVQPLYDSVGHFIEGSCLVKKGGRYGIIDKKGNELVPPQYTKICRLSSNNYRVSINKKWGLIGENGEVIIHPKFDLMKATNQGYFIVKRDDRFGSISEKGISQIPLLYDFIDFDPTARTLAIKNGLKEEWVFIMKTHSPN